MSTYSLALVPKLWQDKRTGQIILTENPENHKESMEWYLNFREVTLHHDPSKGVVFVRDAKLDKTVADLGHPNAEEVDRETFNYLRMLYANPDL